MNFQRYEWVDAAKGLGILLVVFGHVERGLISAGILTSDVWRIIDSMVYAFHMPLFMFLSGFFLVSTYSRKGWLGIVFSKMDTVLYPYVIWMIFQGVVEFVMSPYTNRGAVDVGTILTLWEPKSQFWFLYYLFIFFLFSAILSRFPVVLLIFSTFLYVAFASADTGVLSNFIRFFVFFTLGVVVGRYRDAVLRFFDSKFLSFSLLISFSVSIYVYHYQFESLYTDYSVYTLIVSVLGIGASIAFVMFLPNALSLIFSSLGKASILIYLGHIILASGCRILLDKFAGVHDPVLHVLVGMIIGIIPLWFMFNFSKKLRLEWIYRAHVFEKYARVKHG